MKQGLYKTQNKEFPFFKIKNKSALWVGFNEAGGDPRYRINQKTGYWRLWNSHGEEAGKVHIAPILMTEWQK